MMILHILDIQGICTMQITNPARPSNKAHLARAVALQPQSLLPGSIVNGTAGSPCAHLPPLLAYNLGLSYQLAAFIQSSPACSSAAGAPASQTGLLSLASSSIVLEPWRSGKGAQGRAASATTTALPQHATSICIASIRVPAEDLLQHSHAEQGQDDAGSAGNAAGQAPPKQEAHSEGEIEDDAAADDLVEALQGYFAEMPRYLPSMVLSSETTCRAFVFEKSVCVLAGCSRWAMSLRSSQMMAQARRVCSERSYLQGACRQSAQKCPSSRWWTCRLQSTHLL